MPTTRSAHGVREDGSLKGESVVTFDYSGIGEWRYELRGGQDSNVSVAAADAKLT
ncbi:hypothetical protein [Streptomyces griseoflavus]|uniref:hypothetical protein n=1 Tax=Streptomyces griseoflavus TaxID=35619 RepID=UPI003D738C9F